MSNPTPFETAELSAVGTGVGTVIDTDVDTDASRGAAGLPPALCIHLGSVGTGRPSTLDGCLDDVCVTDGRADVGRGARVSGGGSTRHARARGATRHARALWGGRRDRRGGGIGDVVGVVDGGSAGAVQSGSAPGSAAVEVDVVIGGGVDAASHVPALDAVEVQPLVHAVEGVQPGVGTILEDERPGAGSSRLLRRAWGRWAADTAGRDDGSTCSLVIEPGVELPVGSRRPGRRGARGLARTAHARYLQHVFRSASTLGCWRPGRLGVALCAVTFMRRRWATRCAGGTNLAGEAEFVAQRARAAEVLDWYAIYVALLRRMQSGVTPCVVEGFCGGGGTTEGTRRAGGTSHGIDLHAQSDYVRRFGPEAFTEGDAVDWSAVKALAERTRATGGFMSPPCQPYSTATQHTRHPALIGRVRDMLRSLFDAWSIENVGGARRDMHGDVVELRGSLFGLRVARARLFESSFHMHVDEYLSVPASALEARCCLGARRRWNRFDEFGRARPGCCSGNIFCPLGKTPWRCTAAECASAMGVDEGHMSYERLAQSVPPAYASLRFSQMCMAVAHDRFGAPVITFDEMLTAPHVARRTMAMWLRGAGDASATAGMVFERPGMVSGASPCAVESEALAAKLDAASWCAGAPGFDAVEEATHREFFYSHAGGYDRCCSTGYAAGGWLGPLARYECTSAEPTADELVGHNTYIDLCGGALAGVWPAIESALSMGSGTRLSVRVDAPDVSRWLRRGFVVLEWEEAYRGNDTESAAARARPLMWSGRRRSAMAAARLVHAEVRPHMDPRDQHDWKPRVEEKGAFIFAPMEVDRDAWAAATDMPAAVRELMVHGADPSLGFDLPRREIPQYELESAEGQRECVWECDRALAVGHLEFVPDDEEHLVRVIHPWQVALKEGKARACQDYSGGLNPATRSASFGLPTAWDVERRMGPDTHFAKRDLRDGFWAVPVSAARRNLFVLRHPSTGRLVRATSLPFGWADSPRLFCSVTEAVAGEFRRRASDEALDCVIHCFVDDYLLQGATLEATQRGIDLLDDVMAGLGLFWAPHKERGPARVIEFLGLLLVSLPDLRCIGLTERRQTKLLARMEMWMQRRGTAATADPVELSQLLGHLVFASQVVPGGRTYMQGMLSQLGGLEVDWARGVVKPLRGAGGDWRRVQLTGAFWRDLEWWQEALVTRNCRLLGGPKRASAAITGTDASDWGTGQVAFLAGGREELQLRFTAAERRRTINWRELLGIVRILELYGERLAGMIVLVEGDNTASIGAASKWASKSEGMQELIRRMFDVCERWDISPRFCHTPGVLLHRPDQTSRGDAVEEPRARVRASGFEMIERRFGRFTEFVGAEREHERVSEAARGGGAHVWMHPTYTTVGSALRRLSERASEADGATLRAVVLVPDEPTAAWRPLLRHFSVEGRWSVGGRQVELSQLGQWRACPARRPTLVLSYPRAVGARVSRVWLGGDRARVLLEGAVLYSPSGRAGRGELYIVREAFDATSESTCCDEREVPTVAVAELLMTEASQGKPAREQRYELGWKPEGRRRPGGSFVIGDGGTFDPWQVSVDLLWEVEHLVHTRVQGAPAVQGAEAAASVDALGQLARTQFSFDYMQADAEIRRAVADAVPLELPATDGARDEDPGPAVPASSRVRRPARRASSAPRRAMRPVLRIGERRSTRRSVAPERVVPGVPGDWSTAGASAGGESGAAAGEPADAVEAVDTSALVLECVPCDDSLVVDTLADAVASLDVAADEPSAAEELTAARAAAAQAVQARRRVAPAAARAEPVEDATGPAQLPPARGSTRLVCRSAVMRCAGCHALIGVGALMRSCGTRVVHDDDGCSRAGAVRHPGASAPARPGVVAAVAPLAARARAAAAVPRAVIPPLRAAGSVRRPVLPAQVVAASAVVAPLPSAPVERARTRKEAVLVARVSTTRVDVALRCMLGECGSTGGRMMCSDGCGVGVHAMCIGVAKAHADLGSLRCGTCRAREMCGGGAPNALLVRSGTKSMLWELSVGQHSTAQGYSEYQRLEREWVASTGCSTAALPRDSEESMIAFLVWMGGESGRARSFVTMWRAASGVCAKTREHKVTKSARVKRVYDDVVKALGELAVPCTQTTRRLLCLQLGLGYAQATLEGSCLRSRGGELILARSRVLTEIEVMGGARVGEGVGDSHGVTANDVVLLTPVAGVHSELGVTVEARIRDSKTGPGRYLNYVGTSKVSEVPSERHLRELWVAYGLDMAAPTVDGGFRVERPDYTVVRADMLGMSHAQRERLLSALRAEVRSPTCASVASSASATITYVRRRVAAKDISEDRRYVNVAGGAHAGTAVSSAMQWMRTQGLGVFASCGAGPLLRATEPGSGKLTHMPLQPGSTYTHHIGALRAAYVISSEMEEPDLELELTDGVAHFANHSNRRFSDRVARETRDRSGVSVMDIDIHFGWNEAQRRKDMQLHYAGLDRAQRVARARVTMYI